MREADVEVILERAKVKYTEAKPRIISDNGPQFIARDFKEFIRISGMTHVRTSPYYPQSNGKIERWHKSLKSECIRPGTPLSLEDPRRLIDGYVEYCNNVRMNTATGYIAPKDVLAGRQQEIHAERDRKLEAARQQRQSRCQRAEPREEQSCRAPYHRGKISGAQGAHPVRGKDRSPPDPNNSFSRTCFLPVNADLGPRKGSSSCR